MSYQDDFLLKYSDEICRITKVPNISEYLHATKVETIKRGTLDPDSISAIVVAITSIIQAAVSIKTITHLKKNQKSDKKEKEMKRLIAIIENNKIKLKSGDIRKLVEFIFSKVSDE